MKRILRTIAKVKLKRTMPAEAMRQILTFCDQSHGWHDEQCTLAELFAYIAVDIVAHIDLAAEARVKPPMKKKEDAEADEDSDSETDAIRRKQNKALELVDVGGADADDVVDETEDIPFNEVSSFPVHDPQKIIGFALQRHDLQTIESKRRLSDSDKQLQILDRAYGAMLSHNFTKQNVANNLCGMSLREKHTDMMALQTYTIRLMKQQGTPDEIQAENTDDAWLPDGGAAQPTGADIAVKVVPLPLALQGPAAVAWQLVNEASCTEEQIGAVALLALSLQKRFDARPDKTTHCLPVATAENNHRAIWLGGGASAKPTR